MQNLVIALLLVAVTLLPGPAPAPAGLTCAMRTARTGQRICWCRANRPGSRWQTYPTVVCAIVNRK